MGTHPIGKAFTDYLEENKIELLKIENFENISGLGIAGTINNEEILLGNSKILVKYEIINKYENDEKRLSEKGNSIVYVVKNREILAIIGVNDVIRKEAPEVIKSLSNNKIDTVMLTRR